MQACSAPGGGWCVARRITGDVPEGELGFRFGEPLDVDGDGHADIAAGTRFKRQHGTLQNGSAAVWSGASGALIRAWDGDLPDGLFGHWVLPVPDLGHDGLADVIIAAPNARSTGPSAACWWRARPRPAKRSGSAPAAATRTSVGISRWPVTRMATDAATSSSARLPADARASVSLERQGRHAAAYLCARRGRAHVRMVRRPTRRSRRRWACGSRGRGAAWKDAAANTPAGAAYVFSSASGKELYHWRGTTAGSGFGEVVAAVGGSRRRRPRRDCGGVATAPIDQTRTPPRRGRDLLRCHREAAAPLVGNPAGRAVRTHGRRRRRSRRRRRRGPGDRRALVSARRRRAGRPRRAALRPQRRGVERAVRRRRR